MRILLIGNKTKCSDEHIQAVRRWISARHTIIGESFEEDSIAVRWTSRLCSEDNVQAAVVLGGDGTIISTIAHFKAQFPILGINFGKVGYLANFRFDSGGWDREDWLDNALTKSTLSRRVLLRVRVGKQEFIAANDFVVDIGPPFRATSIELEVDEKCIAQIDGDGLIVATPTGSTAYNLSAGGPILEPTLPAIVLTPKNPHRLTFRPIVVSSAAKISVRVLKPNGAYGIVDGQHSINFGGSDSPVVEIVRNDTDLLLFESKPPWQTLQEKLRWGC